MATVLYIDSFAASKFSRLIECNAFSGVLFEDANGAPFPDPKCIIAGESG